MRRVRSELGAFKIRCGQQVGWLHEELDELERAIPEAELVDEATAQGKDLIREIVGRLKVDMMIARNRLEARSVDALRVAAQRFS